MKNDLVQYLFTRKERINNFLNIFISNQKYKDNKLYKAIFYSLLNGGKRLRPILVYASGEIFNADLDILDVPAAAVELIHCFSLVHDDLPAMDNDDFRRGQLTCHKKFDEATAILAGDALAMIPFQILTDDSLIAIDNKIKLELIKILTESSLQMVVGQEIDMDTSLQDNNNILLANRISGLAQIDSSSLGVPRGGDEKATGVYLGVNEDGERGSQQSGKPKCGEYITIEKLEEMYELKTGALIRASVKLGAIASGVNDKKCLNNLDEFAKSIGLAFQIQDDIFDLEDPDKLDKNKIIYPTLAGVEKSKIKVKELFDKAISALDNIREDTSTLKSLANYIMLRTF